MPAAVPRSRIVRQVRAAIAVRAAVLGRDFRPLGWRNRRNWLRLTRYYTVWLTYAQIEAHAAALGATLATCDDVIHPTPEGDERLRRILSARLRDVTRGLPRRSREDQAKARADERLRDALLAGDCPLCGSALPCAPCGVPRVAPDGHGSLRPLD